ncbi:putative autophagy-related protein 11 isoform X2 [Clytia hemisphaerica]|uniref:Uncharacterized protein n=1 Tax=Clytia hemisphaerica TaxID=252671 RepID=A0A7M5V5T8_9CNID
MASRRNKDWAFVDNKDKKSKKSKNQQRKKDQQRRNEFEFINANSSSDEHQYEVIPQNKVRTFESEPLQVCEDYYTKQNNNNELTDADIEIISTKDQPSSLYAQALLKNASPNDSIDSDEIEDAEDVLAVELGHNNDAIMNDGESANVDVEDYGIEIVGEGSAIDLEILQMKKESILRDFSKTEQESSKSKPKEVQKVVKQDKKKKKRKKADQKLVEDEKIKDKEEVIVTSESDENETLTKTEESESDDFTKVDNEEYKQQKESEDILNDENDIMTMSTYGLASLFDSMYIKKDVTEEREEIVTIKTTTLVILFCVSIAAGMSVGTGIGSLFTFRLISEPADDHRNSLLPTIDGQPPEEFIYIDNEFETTKDSMKLLLAKNREMERKLQTMKIGYEDYKKRASLYKRMSWYWKKRSKNLDLESQIKNYLLGGDDSFVYVVEEHSSEYHNTTDEELLTNLTDQISHQRRDAAYWRNKYTSLKLSKLRTCAKIGQDLSTESFSFSTCLIALSSAIPDLNIGSPFASLRKPVERLSNHVNKAWINLKNKWKKEVKSFHPDSAVVKKKARNVQRFRKMFSYGNIVADEKLKQTPVQPPQKCTCPPPSSPSKRPSFPKPEESLRQVDDNDEPTFKKGEPTNEKEEVAFTINMIQFSDGANSEPVTQCVWADIREDLRCDKDAAKVAAEQPAQDNTPKAPESSSKDPFVPEADDNPECIQVFQTTKKIYEETMIDMKDIQPGPDCHKIFMDEDQYAEFLEEENQKKVVNEKYQHKQHEEHQKQKEEKKFDHEQQTTCEKENPLVDLLSERGARCDKECIAAGIESVEDQLRAEKAKLKLKLDQLMGMFRLYKSKSKMVLKKAKRDMKRKMDETKEQRRERIRRLKAQKLELKMKLKEVREKQRARHQDEINELEDHNHQLKKQIHQLEKEKRHWERFERFNLRQNLENLEESLERQKEKYESKIKKMKMKFKKFVEQQKTKEKKCFEREDENEEEYQAIKLINDRLQRKLDYYKKRHNQSQIQLDKIKRSAKQGKARAEKKQRKIREKQRRKARSLEKFRHGDSYDDELVNLNLPIIPSVYCPDQNNCIKNEEESKNSVEDLKDLTTGETVRNPNFKPSKTKSAYDYLKDLTTGEYVKNPEYNTKLNVDIEYFAEQETNKVVEEAEFNTNTKVEIEYFTDPNPEIEEPEEIYRIRSYAEDAKSKQTSDKNTDQIKNQEEEKTDKKENKERSEIDKATLVESTLSTIEVDGEKKTFTVMKYVNGEEEYYVVRSEEEEEEHKKSFTPYPPKPSPPKMSKRRPQKPTPPKRFQEFEERVQNAKLERNRSATDAEENIGSFDEEPEEEIPYPSWYIRRSESRADERDHNDVYDENGWYTEMMHERADSRDEEEKRAAEGMNWYFQSLLDKEEERTNWYLKKKRDD